MPHLWRHQLQAGHQARWQRQDVLVGSIPVRRLSFGFHKHQRMARWRGCSGATFTINAVTLSCWFCLYRATPAAAASASLAPWHEGAQTACDFPMNLRVAILVRTRCLPHKKHDMVAAPKLRATFVSESKCVTFPGLTFPMKTADFRQISNRFTFLWRKVNLLLCGTGK